LVTWFRAVALFGWKQFSGHIVRLVVKVGYYAPERVLAFVKPFGSKESIFFSNECIREHTNSWFKDFNHLIESFGTDLRKLPKMADNFFWPKSRALDSFQ
jgi:hypothetical protein